MPAGSFNSLSGVEATLLELLGSVYGTRLDAVLESLRYLGNQYYFRANSLVSDSRKVLAEMRSSGIDVGAHETAEDACFIRTMKTPVAARGTIVVADRFAAEAVLQGAHLYSPGVKHCHGLKAGCEASVADEKGTMPPLSKILPEACSRVGGFGDGHAVAASGVFPVGKERESLEEIDSMASSRWKA